MIGELIPGGCDWEWKALRYHMENLIVKKNQIRQAQDKLQRAIKRREELGCGNFGTLELLSPSNILDWHSSQPTLAPVSNPLGRASSSANLEVCAVTSVSPEDKYGPIGYDPPGTEPCQRKHFVRGDQPFEYRIDFWNKEDAPVPTQDVFIKDTLDANLDWSTFEFGEFGFLKWNVPVAPGQKALDTNVDLRPDMSLRVHLRATFNPNSGIVNWVFNSLDPYTDQPPDDPQAGFLPPITNTGYEIGWVTFKVKPKANLPTGTQIKNQAWVKFDVDVYKPAPPNPDSERPGCGPWINTIDPNLTNVEVSRDINLPRSYSLSQNYPNPFNPTTTIRFDVPKPSHVTIKIYDILGREVRTLIDRKFEAGRFVEIWDGKDNRQLPVASGVYLMRMQAGGFVKVKKLVLVR
jgi:hypothetical protein